MCNSFFIDLVSTICFKDNSPPEKEVIDVLLNLLFAQKELLRGTFQSKLLSARRPKSILASSSDFFVSDVNNELPPLSLVEGHREHTKSLSPFDDVVDKTPVIRSVVLKLLLKYR